MEKIPKVFISYSWTSPAHVEKVIQLAERLVDHGVEVLLDKWNLKEGQDKYAFMEQAVTDTDVDKVLLICDKEYTDKANKRIKGVGDETAIISTEVYGKVEQEKYIPVIFEKDEDEKPYCPAYVKSRIYIDLSVEDDNYEIEYEKLLRNIYNKPLYKKPVLGKKPEWLEEDSTNLSPIRDIIRQIKGYSGTNKSKADSLIRRFIDIYNESLTMYDIKKYPVTGELIVEKINELKPIRDLYIDFVYAIITMELLASEIITTFFETTYNTVLEARNESDSYNNHDFEHYQFLIWELFICTIAILSHNERFEDINNILCHTYFLRDSFFRKASISPKNFTQFWHYFNNIELGFKPKSSEPRLYTYTGKILTEREKKPIITKESIADADILLCQLSSILGTHNSLWFPTSYVYCNRTQLQWIKLKSKKYCLKVLPMFGVKTVEELKDIIQKYPVERTLRYNGCFDEAPMILSIIKHEEIATLY